MSKGLLFFCCSCCILVFTIINLSIGPIVNGTISLYFENVGTSNCKLFKDLWDNAKDADVDDDYIKYHQKYDYNACQRLKGMHDMEYTSFIFDVVIGFVCGLIGLLHLFDLKKDFVSNTGLIGLICGIVGFVFTFVYVIFNGVVYTTVYVEDVYKRDGDYAFAEKNGGKFECLYYDDKYNENSVYAKINDLGKKQYNYKHEWDEDIEDISCKISSENMIKSCGYSEKVMYGKDGPEVEATDYQKCDNLYVNTNIQNGIENKDLSDRFLTTLDAHASERDAGCCSCT